MVSFDSIRPHLCIPIEDEDVELIVSDNAARYDAALASDSP